MYYEDHLDALLHHDPELQRNFPNSIWSAARLQLRPRTVTRRHRDCANVPFGWCGVTSLGDFDPKQGGHLVLWTLKLVIEFPPGFNHSAPIRGHTPLKHPDFEARTTGVVYPIHGRRARSMGGARLSAEGGFLAGLAEEQRVAEVRAAAERCKLGLSLFSTLESLPADQTLLNARV